MRSVTMFLFESNWERDFSCLSINSSTFSRQDGAISLLDAKRNIVTDLIAKGKVILQNPDKPKFLEANVNRIQV